MDQLLGYNNQLSEDAIASLFPHNVGVAMSTISGAVEDLYPEEVALIDHAIHKRQTEFASGRLCAKQALASLGIHDYPLLMDNKRAPIWPKGVSGSISHTSDLCVAVASNVKESQSLGVDIEEDNRLRPDLWPQFLIQEGVDLLNQLHPSEDPIKWATVMFAAKEAFYKAQYPLTKSWLGFKDVTVVIDDMAEPKFHIELLIDLEGFWKKGTTFEGRYAFFDRFVYAGLMING